MTRVLLIGKNGQIGWELFNTLQSVADVIATGRSDLDVQDGQKVFQAFEKIKPDVIINATGYNDVDGAEKAGRDDAFSINVEANALMSTAACKINALYVTYSTDYVFDGLKKTPYVESDPTNPVNMYGQTKLNGEMAIATNAVNYLILRTSSVFSTRRPCFLSSFIRKAKESAQIQVRTDLVSTPTSAKYLAEMTTKIISGPGKGPFKWAPEKSGLYHLAGEDIVSRFEWAQQICDILKLDVQLLPSTSADYSYGANRPIYSALDSSKFFKIFGLQSVSWQKMLETTLSGLS